jgi:hypothetical protein
VRILVRHFNSNTPHVWGRVYIKSVRNEQIRRRAHCTKTVPVKDHELTPGPEWGRLEIGAYLDNGWIVHKFIISQSSVFIHVRKDLIYALSLQYGSWSEVRFHMRQKVLCSRQFHDRPHLTVPYSGGWKRQARGVSRRHQYCEIVCETLLRCSLVRTRSRSTINRTSNGL